METDDSDSHFGEMWERLLLTPVGMPSWRSWVWNSYQKRASKGDTNKYILIIYQPHNIASASRYHSESIAIYACSHNALWKIPSHEQRPWRRLIFRNWRQRDSLGVTPQILQACMTESEKHGTSHELTPSSAYMAWTPWLRSPVSVQNENDRTSTWIAGVLVLFGKECFESYAHSISNW